MHREKDIIAWAERVGLMTPATTQCKRMLKLAEEMGELSKEILHGNYSSAMMEIGDMYVVLCQIAYCHGGNMTECANMAYKKISKRKGMVINGTFIKE